MSAIEKQERIEMFEAYLTRLNIVVDELPEHLYWDMFRNYEKSMGWFHIEEDDHG